MVETKFHKRVKKFVKIDGHIIDPSAIISLSPSLDRAPGINSGYRCYAFDINVGGESVRIFDDNEYPDGDYDSLICKPKLERLNSEKRDKILLAMDDAWRRVHHEQGIEIITL